MRCRQASGVTSRGPPHLHEEEDDGEDARRLAVADEGLVVDEERAIGRVTRETYFNYAQEGGAGAALCILLLFGSGQASVMFADYWLKIWATSNDQNSSSLLIIYVALALGTVVICLLRAMIFLPCQCEHRPRFTTLRLRPFWQRLCLFLFPIP